MSALTDFLLARVAEEVETAGRMAPGWHRRRLIECEAKRRIVDYARRVTLLDPSERQAGYELAVGDALRALALPYADHPDYREEWKP